MASTSEVLQQLETCAQIIMAPPDNVTTNDRSKAEEVFLNFQKTTTPFQLCREILESSHNQFVLFQTGACLKNGVIREWTTSLGLEQGRALFNYLFDYVNRRPADQYVIEELMLVAAIIFKRIAIDDPERTQDKHLLISILDIVKNVNSPMAMRLNAATGILQILGEFCSINHNSDYSLSWYSHLIAKRHFEKNRLKEIFQVAIEILYPHLQASDRSSPEWLKLSMRLIRICEHMLHWNFNFILEGLAHVSIQYARSRDRLESLVFQPPAAWVEWLIESNLIPFFFEVFHTFRKIDPQLMHHSLQCLTQLSGMSAPVLHSQRSLGKKFIETFMLSTINLYGMIMNDVTIHEVSFLANLINSICAHLRCSNSIHYCDLTLIRRFIDLMAKFTCQVLQQSIKIRESLDEENFDKCNQAIEYLVTSFAVLTFHIHSIYNYNREDPPNFTNEFITCEELANWTRPVFETYVRAHLSQPEGLLPISCFQDRDEIQEFEEDDHALFRDQLHALGQIAWVDQAGAINTITQLLILRVQQYEACIRMEDCEEKMIQWSRLCEDLHWVLLIAMYQFTSSADNDIPTEVVKVSIAASSSVTHTQHALEHGDFSQSSIDPVVRFFIVLVKFVQLERQLLEGGLVQWVSPQVSLTLSLFIARFMQVYLVPPEFDSDTEMSMTLSTCFGADSPTSTHLVNFFLDHLETKFVALSSEAHVLELASQGLRTFAKFRERIKLLRESPSLNRLLQRFPSDPNFRKLNSVVRRNMYSVFLQVFSQSNVDLVIEPLRARYRVFCGHLASGHKEALQEEFMLIVECSEGIASAINDSTFDHIWNTYLVHLFNDLPQVLKLMHQNSLVVQAILELLFNFSVAFGCFLSEEPSVAFYNTAVNILSEYATHNQNIVSLDATRLEELQAEIIWILKFLNDLSAQDVFIFFTSAAGSSSSSLTHIIGKVVLTSLNIIMPLMNDDLLANDKLCLLYYKILEFIAGDTDRFKGFPIKLLESYLKCVEYAFKANNISNDIKTIGFKILYELAIQTHQEPSEEMLTFLRPFFQVIIEFIFCELVKNSDLSLRDSVGVAFFALICCFQDTYRDLIQQVLHYIGNREAEGKIAAGLFEIIEQLGLDCQRNTARVAFKKKFSDFINKLHTMLSLR